MQKRWRDQWGWASGLLRMEGEELQYCSIYCKENKRILMIRSTEQKERAEEGAGLGMTVM